MLALLMLLFWGGLYARGMTGQTLDILSGVQSALLILIDASPATFCAAIHLRFFGLVALTNYQRLA